MEEKKVVRRLSQRHGHWWRFVDANGFHTTSPSLADFIGTENCFRYKTHTTTKWDTRHKEKYSPNKCRCWRWKGPDTREEDRKLFLNILREHGIK